MGRSNNGSRSLLVVLQQLAEPLLGFTAGQDSNLTDGFRRLFHQQHARQKIASRLCGIFRKIIGGERQPAGVRPQRNVDATSACRQR